MTHTETIIDKDPFFEINDVTREIVNPSSSKKVISQFDHKCEKFSFRLNRIIEGHDMAECNKVKVHFTNTDASTLLETSGVYNVTDLQVDPEDDTKVIFSWLIEINATQKAGKLWFSIEFSCVEEDGTINYSWNTSDFTGLIVSPSSHNTEKAIEPYLDILEQWRKELFDASDEGVENIYTAEAKVIKEISDTSAESVGNINTAVAKAEKAVEDIETALQEVEESLPDDYTKIDASVKKNSSNITGIHNALGMTSVNSVTWRDGWWSLFHLGAKLNSLAETAASRCYASTPIKVNKGDIVTITSKASPNLSVLATTDEQETSYKSVVASADDNTVSKYEYTVTENCYIVAFCRYSVVEEFSIDITPTQSKELEDIKNTLKTGVAPKYYGVKNGGELTSSANGRKATTTVEMIVKNERDVTGWFYGNSSHLMGVYYNTNRTLAISVNVGDYKTAECTPYTKGDISHIVMVYDDDEKSKTAYYNGVLVGKNINESYVIPTAGLVDRMLDGVVVYQKRIWNRVLSADEVSKLYNHGYPTKYILQETLSEGLISNLSHQNITDTGWVDTVTGTEIAFAEGAELYSVDEFNEYKDIAELNKENAVVKRTIHPEFIVEHINGARGNHELTFINDYLVSFNKPSDGRAFFIDINTRRPSDGRWQPEKDANGKFGKFINLTDNDVNGTPRELEMKAVDYKYNKLLIGNGRAIKYEETDYTQQGAKLYVFYNADTWKDHEADEINNGNCGEYDVIDVSGLGYKMYGWWGGFDDQVFISCNLFNDVYLIQLGKGTNNLGTGTYTASATNRYNGSYTILGHWHQDGALGDWAAHGGQYYKGHLYIATNNTDLCTIYKCILNDNGTLAFEALNFDVRDNPNYLKYRYLDGMCIKDDTLYAQPLYLDNNWSQNTKMIVAKL